MLEAIKLSLRISNTAFDEEITDLIEAGKLDLKLSGVNVEDLEEDIDALTKRAIGMYVKANFGLDNPDADRLQLAYKNLKQHLSLCGDYNVMA